jgi:tRNA-2-methylthio-N6-dimethylallyladenosine synthase
VREVTLLGQNVNGFRGPTHDGKLADLALLIDYVALIEGIERIRFTTSHPREFNERLIESYARRAEAGQSPASAGAERFRPDPRADEARAYGGRVPGKDPCAACEVRPDISISTDLIVGFPGETEADFAATMQLIEAIGFDQSFSFVYSPRPGTPAAALADPGIRRRKSCAGSPYCRQRSPRMRSRSAAT